MVSTSVCSVDIGEIASTVILCGFYVDYRRDFTSFIHEYSTKTRDVFTSSICSVDVGDIASTVNHQDSTWIFKTTKRVFSTSILRKEGTCFQRVFAA